MHRRVLCPGCYCMIHNQDSKRHVNRDRLSSMPQSKETSPLAESQEEVPMKAKGKGMETENNHSLCYARS